MKAHGWISGDTHIHWAENSWDVNEDIELLAMVQRAEDLRVANNLTLYQWTPNGSFTKPDQYPMGPVEAYCNDEYHIQMGEEFRNDNFYGHINLLGITKLIEPIATGPGSGGDSTALDYPINKTIIEECHRQGGISCEAHGFGPMVNGSVPINVINGLSDALDQLDPEFYYLLLDCGFRVPLGNGSDHPARVVGCARVYVKVAGEFTYTKWIDGLREDRSFVTSGPLLFFQVDGEDIGSKLLRNTGDKVKITARAISRHPIGTLQVLTNNGQVLGTLETRAYEAEITLEHTIESSQWFVTRCSQSDSFVAIKTAEDYHTARPNIAHSSAIYVDVDGKPVCRPEAVQDIIQRMHMLHHRIAEQGNFANDEQRNEALNFINDGIQKYRALLGGSDVAQA